MKVRVKWGIFFLFVFILVIALYAGASRVRDGTLERVIARKIAIRLNVDSCSYLPVNRRAMLTPRDGILQRGQAPHQLIEMSAIDPSANP